MASFGAGQRGSTFDAAARSRVFQRQQTAPSTGSETTPWVRTTHVFRKDDDAGATTRDGRVAVECYVCGLHLGQHRNAPLELVVSCPGRDFPKDNWAKYETKIVEPVVVVAAAAEIRQREETTTETSAVPDNSAA